MYKTLKDYSTSNKRKIGIFLAFTKGYYFTSSYIRILSPLNELSTEFNFEIIDYRNRKRFIKDLDENKTNMDAIIISRDIDIISKDIEFVKSLYDKLKRNNVKIIFEIDDNILLIDENHTEYDYYKELMEYFIFLIKNSDRVTVSTHHLKGELEKYNENISVIENTLMNQWEFNPDEKIKDLSQKPIITIGYFGTRTHGPDLELLEEPIRNVKKHFKDKTIEFEMVGVTKSDYDWIRTIPLPNNYREKPNIIDHALNLTMRVLNKLNLTLELPHCQFIEWMKNETDWDIGVAPLHDNKFNKNKSNLKYLEYGALNVAGAYSNVEPYKDIKKKNSGIVVENTAKEWENALISLIENRELYESIMVNSRKDISENYTVKNSSEKWREILKEFV